MTTPKRTAAPLKTPEGKAFYQAILERNTRSARKSHRITQAFGALCLIALPISLHYFGPALWTYFLPFGIFMGVISRVEPRTLLTENEYRHLQDTLGKPNHCVHCGNTRFERHYYGRSNYEVLKCEGCHNTVYRA